MPLIAKENSAPSDPAPEGTHVARCIQIIDKGTHYGERFKKWEHKVLFGWELPHALRDATDERPAEPYLVWQEYNLSLHEKSKLRKALEAWRGKKFVAEELQGFDLKNVLESTCLLQILHNEKGYADIASIAALPKGTSAPPIHHDKKYFVINEWDEAVFQTFSEKLKQTILSSEEGKARLVTEVREEEQDQRQFEEPQFASDSDSDSDDDVPF